MGGSHHQPVVGMFVFFTPVKQGKRQAGKTLFHPFAELLHYFPAWYSQQNPFPFRQGTLDSKKNHFGFAGATNRPNQKRTPLLPFPKSQNLASRRLLPRRQFRQGQQRGAAPRFFR